MKTKAPHKKPSPKINTTPKKGKVDLKTMQKCAQEKKRLLAEIDNLQKIHNQRLVDQIKYANQELIVELLEPLNNFERCLSHSVQNPETKKFLIGMQWTYDKLMKILNQKGLSRIVCREGDDFDEYDHEAIDTTWDGRWKANQIVSIRQQGYKLGGRVLQPVKVVINKKDKEKKK